LIGIVVVSIVVEAMVGDAIPILCLNIKEVRDILAKKNEKDYMLLTAWSLFAEF
jgi:hypothetical protein